jgi:hypothetical protein
MVERHQSAMLEEIIISAKIINKDGIIHLFG